MSYDEWNEKNSDEVYEGVDMRVVMKNGKVRVCDNVKGGYGVMDVDDDMKEVLKDFISGWKKLDDEGIRLVIGGYDRRNKVSYLGFKM